MPDTLKAARAGQLQMWGLANTNTTTEGYGFLGLLYGGNAGLLEPFAVQPAGVRPAATSASRRCPTVRSARSSFGEMSALVTAYAPWMLDAYRYENVVVYPWVVGYKYNGIYQHPWPYLDIDRTRRAAASDGASRSATHRWLAGVAAALLAALAPLAAPARGAKWADPAKTLRVMFPIAETGFDPQATSRLLLVARAARDLRFALPLRLPRAAVPLRAEHRGGDARDLRRRPRRGRSGSSPGIYFADDPAFKGKKRELTAADYVYSWKRLLDPRMRAPFLWYLDGKVVGADAVLAKAKAAGRLDYDAPIEGLQALDRYTLRLTLKEPDYVTAGLHVAAADGGGRARGDRGVRRRERLGDGEPGRHRALPARRSGGAGRRSCSRPIRHYREDVLSRKTASPDDRDLIAAMKGKRLPQIGRVEICDHRGIESAAARVRQPRARLRQRAARTSCRKVLDAGNRLQARATRSRASGSRAAMQPSLAYCVLQHGRPGRRRLHAGEDRAAPRDRDGATTRRT